jgi:hypothetical protein
MVVHLLFVFLALTIGIILCFLINKLVENYTNNQPGFELCKNPNHDSITDCQLALKTRKWDEFNCEIANIMFYTIQIRRNIEREINYTKVIRVFDHIRNNNIEFPLECRIIGSMCTNILQCSSDPTEAAWAQSVNMFIQFEKLHILSDWDQKTDLSCNFKNITRKNSIFEGYSCHNGDLFRNVYIRDVEDMKAFPIVLFLYKRALKLLITEPRSITYSIYFHKQNLEESKFIKTFLNLT